MSKMRHWKQRFDPTAKMVFRKRRKFALGKDGYMSPGDPVTDEIVAALGRQRLKMWWEAGYIELAEYEAPKPHAVQQAEQHAIGNCLDGPDCSPEPLAHIGGGWYDVTLPDGSTERVHGKKKAEQLLAGDSE